LFVMLLVVAILVSVVVFVFASNVNIDVQSNRFRANYLEMYYDTINVMFDNNWTLLSEEHMVREGDCHKRYGTAIEWIRWDIEYIDANGEVQQFRFNNSMPFYRQIERYVLSFILDNFREQFFSAQVRLLRGNPFMDMHQGWYRTANGHIRQFATPEGAVPISQLTLANAFELLPMYISFGVGTSDAQTVDGRIEEIENMLESLNSFTNNRLNVNVIAQLDGVHYRWYYLNGELFRELDGVHPNFIDNSAFEVYVFNALRGVFW